MLKKHQKLITKTLEQIKECENVIARKNFDYANLEDLEMAVYGFKDMLNAVRMHKYRKLYDKEFCDALYYANKQQLTQFIYKKGANFYYSKWHKNKWSEPKIITKL